MLRKFEIFLSEDKRAGEQLPPIIKEISEHRIALTHSEPHDKRTAELAAAVSGTKAAEYAKELRAVAEWLWQKKRPQAVSASFDQPNAFLS